MGSIVVTTKTLAGQTFRLTQVDLRDRTDMHNEPVVVTEHEVSDEPVSLHGNLFVIDNLENHEGLILVRRSPLAPSRPDPIEADIQVELQTDGVRIKLYRAESENETDLWEGVPYAGGLLERSRALQNWQRSLRPNTPTHRVPLFITNTWGDRSRDARLCEEFMLKELEAAGEIGADVVRIDDGWQSGLSGNSAFKGDVQTQGLSGFWGVSNSFWQVHPERFPNGLEPLLKKAKEVGVELGLWYAPDSENELANWEKDVDTLLEFYEKLGIRHFKIDGLNVVSPLAHERIHKLLSTLAERSGNGIMLMLDCTGNHSRPGYLGAVPYGDLFVENRYTDWGNYWPHSTLRKLWELSYWLDPARLRMEFLNNERNANHKRYADQPLSPCNYPPDYLFATVMMCNPLGWFEASNLSADFRASITPLVKVWREHREAIFTSTIVPIGEQPSGESWPGFAAVSEDRQTAYVLCFREFTETASGTYELPFDFGQNATVSTLTGEGTSSLDGTELTVSIPNSPGFVFMKVERS